MPVFLENVLENVPKVVRDACGDNLECIFDYYETGKEEIGIETISINTENMNDQIQACKT